MKKELIVRLKNEAKIQFQPFELTSTSHFLEMNALVSEHGIPLLLNVEHDGLTTVLDLSKLPDCVLLHIDESKQLAGATYCLNKASGTFSIQTQSKRILFIPMPIPFSLEEVNAFIF